MAPMTPMPGSVKGSYPWDEALKRGEPMVRDVVSTCARCLRRFWAWSFLIWGLASALAWKQARLAPASAPPRPGTR